MICANEFVWWDLKVYFKHPFYSQLEMCYRHFGENERIPSGISFEWRLFIKQVIIVKYNSISAYSFNFHLK